MTESDGKAVKMAIAVAIKPVRIAPKLIAAAKNSFNDGSGSEKLRRSNAKPTHAAITNGYARSIVLLMF